MEYLFYHHPASSRGKSWALWGIPKKIFLLHFSYAQPCTCTHSHTHTCSNWSLRESPDVFLGIQGVTSRTDHCLPVSFLSVSVPQQKNFCRWPTVSLFLTWRLQPRTLCFLLSHFTAPLLPSAEQKVAFWAVYPVRCDVRWTEISLRSLWLPWGYIKNWISGISSFLSFF